ncbi:MAG: hypothetical protein R6V07_13525 [Armatimonadota bacterium]
MRQGRGGGRSRVKIDFVQKLRDLSVTGMKLAALVFAISIAYILYAVYGGHLGDAVGQRVISNLQLMGQTMAISGAIFTICLVIVTFEEIAVAVVAGLFGVGLVLGFPLMVAGQVSTAAQRAGEIITNWAGITGQTMVAIVGLRIMIEIVNYIREAPARRAQMAKDQGLQPAKKKAGGGLSLRLSRCWDMPYCHEAIKEMCPAFKNRKNCWRLKQGCNCDPHLIESLLKRGGSTDVLPEQGSTYIQNESQKAGAQPGTVRTRECRNCPIFNEHQREKFRLLNPIMVAASIIGLIAAYPLMQKLYTQFITFLASLAQRFALSETVPVSEWIERFDTPGVWTFFYIIVGLLLLSYVLKAVEWAVLKRKIV